MEPDGDFVITWASERNSSSGYAIIAAQRFDATGQDLRLTWRGQPHQVRLTLIGGFQAENVTLAAGLAIASGEPAGDVIAALPHLVGVRGRMQLAATRRNGASVFVDYAHTPDGLRAAIAALRPHTNGKLITVFGAGGDRDTGKRPEMGAVAVADSDIVIVTDDNPRSEDPSLIRADIMAGAPGAHEIGDRRYAIAFAIEHAEPDDIVLIAGKGHEQGQIIMGRVLPFDDVEVARECAA